MNIKYILITLGEPYSTFSEIIGKYFIKKRNFKKKIILIGNKKLLHKQLKKLNYSFNLNQITNIEDSKNNMVNIINVEFKYGKVFSIIDDKSNNYIGSEQLVPLTVNQLKRQNCVSGVLFPAI